MVEKYINKNGDVAVIYTDTFGGGWSTWDNEHAEERIFDRDIVKCILDYKDDPHGSTERFNKLVKEKWPNTYKACNLTELTLDWLEPGTNFMVHEYDGQESIWTINDIKKYIA